MSSLLKRLLATTVVAGGLGLLLIGPHQSSHPVSADNYPWTKPSATAKANHS